MASIYFTLSFSVHFAMFLCLVIVCAYTHAHTVSSTQTPFAFLFIVTVLCVSVSVSAFSVHFPFFSSYFSFHFIVFISTRFIFVRSPFPLFYVLFSFIKFNWISTREKKRKQHSFVTIWMQYIYSQYYLTGRLITQIKFDNSLKLLIYMSVPFWFAHTY